jgi:PIN domain nuclease of toxin-antitoxin system
MSAVNYSEVLKKSIEHGGSAATTAGLLVRTEVQIIPFDTNHGQIAAELWQSSRQLGLSLGDRACLALAIAVSGTVFTADRRMAEAAVPVKIVLVRGGH